MAKSGGIATNIGVHFFDMLSWIFGKQTGSTVNMHREDCAAGILELEHARIRWFLSINADHLPAEQKVKGQRTYRAITMGGEAVEFSEGFTDLHTVSYRSILDGDGFTIGEARNAIEMVHAIRHAPVTGLVGDYHPACREVGA
jgi:UDP-N-acetyl-2-amino-2-deoxyglucuronate dehydrogenase